MRVIVGAVLVLALAGCANAVECSPEKACPTGAQCVDGLCVAATDGGGGGVGGGTGGGTGGGVGGGGGDAGMGGGTGGGGGGSPMCTPDCAAWEVCESGTCKVKVAALRWVAPMDGSRVKSSAMVPLAVEALTPDGGRYGGADLSLEWTDTSVTMPLAQGQQYSGMGQSPAGMGTWNLTARFAGADGGPRGTAALTLDPIGPTFTVTPLNRPTYSSDGGFIEADPSAPNAVKKDDTVTLRVESTDTDVDPTTVSLSVMTVDGGESWGLDAGVPCNSGSAFCRDYELALGPQPMNNFVDSVTATVTGDDDVGNAGGGVSPNVLTVTRWKWARQVSSQLQSLRTTPAIADGGTIIMGINAASAPNGLAAVKPNGTLAWGPTNDGPVEGSAAVGRDDVGVEYAVYQLATTTNPLKAVNAQSGVGVGATCPAPSGTASRASLAILRNGTADVMGLGVQPASTANQAVTQRPLASCRDTGTSVAYSAVQFPGNVVGLGDTAYWVGSNGALRGAQWNAGSVTVTPLATNVSVGGIGIVNGLAALSGARIVGGGGPGIGRLFAFEVPAGTAAWSMPTMLSTPTSGPLVVSAGVVAAIRSSSDKVQLIRVGAADGIQTALTPELQAKGLTSSFTGTQVPTPVAGQGGLLYVVDEAGRVFVLPQSFGNATQPSWAVALPAAVAGTVTASPSLDCNRSRPASETGVLYLATESGWLVSYIVDSKGLDTTAPWPKYQRDAWNSGNGSTIGYGPPCP